MSERNFMQLLTAQMAKGNSVCVGLDVDSEMSTPGLVPNYWRHAYVAGLLVESTSDTGLVAAYLLDASRFPGGVGRDALQQVISFVHEKAPAVPVILQGIAVATQHMARITAFEVFDVLGADAVVLDAYANFGLVDPFLAREDKGVIGLCLTSGPDAQAFQRVMVRVWTSIETGSGYYPEPLDEMRGIRNAQVSMYEYAADHVARIWNYNKNCCVAVGVGNDVTFETEDVRRAVDRMPMLLLDADCTKDSFEEVIDSALDPNLSDGVLVNLSMEKFVGDGGPGFELRAIGRVIELHKAIADVHSAIAALTSDRAD